MYTKLSKEIIENELKTDGSLKNKTKLTNYFTPQQLYNFYHMTEDKKCVICGNKTKFLNFKQGYDEVCSRSCRKEYKSKNYIPDYTNIISIEELKIFIIKNFTNCNTSNKLNVSFFITNNYIKEINTILLYMKTIGEEKLTIKLLHQLVFGVGICAKCGSETTFRGFGKSYPLTCSENKCSKSLHINDFVDYEYVINNFIENNKFRVDKMMKYYNVSYSYVNKWKVKNNILIENKHKRYSLGERIIFYAFKDNHSIRTNNRIIINPYEIDFVIDDKLCVEYDGLLFHSKGQEFPGDCSKRFKDKMLPEKYQLLTIFEDEFINENKKNIWLSIIRKKLLEKKDDYIGKIKEISDEHCNNFLYLNDLNGEYISNIKIGMFDANDNLIQVLCAEEYEKDKYILTRICNSKEEHISYTNILNYFENKYKPKTIRLILNKRWNSENDFKNYGFDLINETPPKAYYFKVNENILYEVGDKDEQELVNNLYRIIYDYGNIILEKTLKEENAPL
jgi:hypothetical protein